MLFSIIDANGFQRYANLDEVRIALDQPDLLFFDDFKSLWIEGGQSPTIGARYVDSFAQWGVRRLKNAPNLDQGVKRYVPGKTHLITGDGLLLRSYANPDEETGFTASMISTERSFSFTYGRVDVTLKLGDFPPGVHKTIWLMPTNGSGNPEIDIAEFISNNHLGRADNLHFMNAKDTPKGIDHFEWQSLPDGFLNDFHEFSLIWEPDRIAWLRDGEEVKSAPNVYDAPMYLMITDEIGQSVNGQFPGPLESPLPADWQTETIIKSIKVTGV